MNNSPRLGQFGGMIGFGLVGLGFLLMLLGYTLAAGQPTGDVRLQFPYLLSCGLPGLGLVVLGSSLVRTFSARLDRDLIIAAILDSGLSQPPVRLVPPQSDRTRVLGSGSLAGSADAAGMDDAAMVIAGSSSFHLESCRLVVGRDAGEWIPLEHARELALTPCRVCKPELSLSR